MKQQFVLTVTGLSLVAMGWGLSMSTSEQQRYESARMMSIASRMLAVGMECQDADRALLQRDFSLLHVSLSTVRCHYVYGIGGRRNPVLIVSIIPDIAGEDGGAVVDDWIVQQREMKAP